MRSTPNFMAMILLAFLSARSYGEPLTLRDAVYLYNQDIPIHQYIEIVGYRCDILMLALDVDSGYADLQIYEGESKRVYPDRIRQFHEMFAYALYSQNVAYKSFMLTDNTATQGAAETISGRATVFGYCYSTHPDARVFRYDSRTQSCANANGIITCPANGNWRF